LDTNEVFKEIGFGIPEITENITKNGMVQKKMKSLQRKSWNFANPLIILYSLYLFAEKCGNYYQFTLTRLLNHDIDSDGVSPTEIFGIDRDSMEKILNGLTVNYPEFITASFTIDLDNISLKSDKTSDDVLELF
jgi:phosphoadenosine phosphosulfate reductase